MDDEMPEWLAWQAELDCCRWQLSEMYRALKARPPLYATIDQASGIEQQRIEQAKALVARAHELEALLLAAGCGEA